MRKFEGLEDNRSKKKKKIPVVAQLRGVCIYSKERYQVNAFFENRENASNTSLLLRGSKIQNMFSREEEIFEEKKQRVLYS